MTVACSLAPAPPNADGGAASPPFDKGAVIAALGSVDAQPCLHLVSPPLASVHAKMKFLPTGAVDGAFVDDPAEAPATVVACVVGRLKLLHVPVFSGAALTVGRRFVLRD